MPRHSKLVMLGLVPLGALALVGGSHTGAAAAVTHQTRIPAGHASTAGWLSGNWSGYAMSGASGAFHSITGKWTVTKVGATSGATYSSSWIGIDGFANSDLIQTGTEADYYGGSAHYDAWWEILPAPETMITSMTVHPGDHMSASITKGTTWKITITDTTTGQSFTTNQVYAGPGASAEWIEEAPEVNGSIAKLAHYGQVKFDPGTVNGANPKLTASESGIMVQSGKHVSTPSNPDSDTDGFNVKYGATQPSPPSS
jgi:Peptidase A4 family